MEDFFSKLHDLLKSLIEEAVSKAVLGKVPYPPAPVTMDDKKILTRKQAAAYIQVTPATLSLYVRQGKLSHVVINGKYRFFETDLVNFLNDKKG